MIPIAVNVIAEIANAHQGNPEWLHALIQKAADSHADAIKFQWFKYDHLATPDYPWYPAYQDLFIPVSVWEKALQLSKQLGLNVWVDVLDDWAVSLLEKVQKWIDGLKVPSTILQSPELPERLSRFKKPVLIGVGGWSDEEIDTLLPEIRQWFPHDLILQHGFQGYPTQIQDASIARIPHLKKRYGLPVGFADHTDGSHPLALELPVYAYFAGATIIEKHLTLDRSQKGYDYYSSLEPEEFSVMVRKLKTAKTVMGSEAVTDAQRAYLKDAGRVVAAQNIAKGELISREKVAFKRCTDKNGLMPISFREQLPAVVRQPLVKDQAVTAAHLKKPVVTIAVICRLKSTRLPKKALRLIHGVRAIERCLLNCLTATRVDHVVLATSDLPQDRELESINMRGRVRVLKGDPDHVARRMEAVAAKTQADIILRVTGDNPAVSPEILDLLIESHLQGGFDFSAPTENHAIGTGADVITVEALKRLINQPKPLTHTEYLSAYFIHNPDRFSVNRVELPAEFQYPQWRLTLDEPKDLKLFERIYRDLDVGYEPLAFSRIRSYLQANPEVCSINADVRIKYKDDGSLMREIRRATRLTP